MKDSVSLIISLRKSGKTYSEIRNITGFSKSNISYVCSKYIKDNHIISNTNAGLILQAKIQNLSKRSIEYFKKNKEERILYWHQKLSQIPASYVYYMSGLYDGEGNHSGKTFSICNSDKNIVLFILEFAKLIDTKVITSLYLHNTHVVDVCQNYWSLPFNYIRQYDSRRQSKSNRFRENYGTVRIDFVRPLGLFDALRGYSLAHNPSR